MAGKKIKVQGPSVEEALAEASALLGVEPGSLNYQVIAEASKGFLGLGKRPAVIEVWVEAPEEGEDNKSSEEATPPPHGRCGRVWVENGQIKVVDGLEGPLPVIIPVPEIELIVDGEIVREEAQVRAASKLEVRPRLEEEPGNWKIEISPDGLTATLYWQPKVLKTWELLDAQPSPRLQLKTREVRKTLPPFGPDELRVRLKELNITYGIDENALQEACSATAPQQLVLARGRPPQPGKDAWIEYFFLMEEAARVEVDEEEKVDYREMIIRSSVAAGEVLAVKHPALPGEAGMSVTGKEIPPPEPRDVILVAGKGVRVIENGFKCIATQEGRPVVRQRQGQVIIEVVPVFLHRGDVDLASGNLKFKGSIEITGSVTETMVVEATRDIKIMGDVAQATIRAGGSLTIQRNCIGSILIAGGLSSFYQGAQNILSDVVAQLTQLVQALEQIGKDPSFQRSAVNNLGSGYLISILLQNKFRRLPELSQELEALIQTAPKDMVEEKLLDFSQNLRRSFKSAVTMQALKAENIREYQAAASELLAFCQDFPKTGHVILNYALNSKIQAGGNVKITGRGCYSTEIVAGGKVEIQGIFRGGSITAGADVIVKEVGSSGGTRSKIRVPDKATIKIGRAWANTTLQVGRYQRTLDTEMSQVMVYLNSDGELVFGVA
ncbi:MAG: uncharacterized protein PWP65_359 [Clostridia bacterium]|nr:uncharacterized protein [Clostridia bacterium]